jgi:trigger factor
VGDAELERVLTRLREQGATWWPVETGAPQVGDQVSVTVQRLDAGRESEPRTYEVVLGEGNAIPDVEASIATLEPGSTADFTVRFPEDDGSGEEGTQLLRISLLERRIRELPELDDAFARSVGDFETLDALKARLKEDLEREAEAQSEAAVRGQLLDHILQANPFDVPQSMVDGYVDSLLGDTKDTDPERLARVRDQLRPEAEHAVKRLLALERAAHTQQLRATALEIDERIELIAGKNQLSPSEVYARLQKSGQLQAMEREITEEKVFSFLKEQSKIEEPA